MLRNDKSPSNIDYLEQNIKYKPQNLSANLSTTANI